MTAYGYHWRTVERPAALVRSHYACARCDMPDRPSGLRSALDGAHLDGDTTNGADDNVVMLCRKCHRGSVDYDSWMAKFKEYLKIRREQKADENDAGREILAYLAALEREEHHANP